MNILVIGNGFDLAHGLPTGYGDFLDIMLCAGKCEVAWDGETPRVVTTGSLSSKKIAKYQLFCKGLSQELIEELKEISQKSFWIDYFDHYRSILGDKWMDFEEGIKEVVWNTYNDKKKETGNVVSHISTPELNKHLRKLDYFRLSKSYKDLFKMLQKDLQSIMRAMSIYMDRLVLLKTQEIEKQQVISNLKVDKLLSFNYTRTYTEVYGIPDDYCYIHGKADCLEKSNNLVLGYNGQDVPEAETAVELVPFEKYYQRIVKCTDNNYINWLNNMSITQNENVVYFFGHSLAPSDGDVIEKLITFKNMKTVIFYVDDEDRANKINNLAIVLGRQRLVELAGGPERQITWSLIQ